MTQNNKIVELPRSIVPDRSELKEFSLIPFWFWNDVLSEDELCRQMDDFLAHGVYGFVIHPRVGLPQNIGWMSERLLYFVRFAVEQAARRKMQVVLYDEGMYPSGSSSGLVVAENPKYKARGLAIYTLKDTQDKPRLAHDENLLAILERPNDRRIAIIERPIDSVIRGLHYMGEGPDEETPPAADILNPDAVASFVRHSYDGYYQAVGDYFGSTIIGMFTDEPSLTGRCREENIQPGTRDILDQVNRILGYDFTPHLASLWFDDEPEAKKYRDDYLWAVHQRLEETYYSQLSRWCRNHGVALMGHPEQPDDLGPERYFDIPGQDLVWRWVLPNTSSALEGPQSTQAKCSSSAMIHLGCRRNANECFGAYGHELTFQETQWLINWCVVRGVNMFFPHAFYYSVRPPRHDERPPDVGPHSSWWNDYKPFAEACSRLCAINADAQHVCSIAVLGISNYLPWDAAKILYKYQHDFNYLEARHLWEDAKMDDTGIHLREMHYQVMIIDSIDTIPSQALPALLQLAKQGRLLIWNTTSPACGGIVCQNAEELISRIDHLLPPDIQVTGVIPGLRYRHMLKPEGIHYYLFFNESDKPISTEIKVSAVGEKAWFEPTTGRLTPMVSYSDLRIDLSPGQLRVLKCDDLKV
jgi:hypothetical protein